MHFILLKIQSSIDKFYFSNWQISNHDPRLCPFSALEKCQQFGQESDGWTLLQNLVKPKGSWTNVINDLWFDDFSTSFRKQKQQYFCTSYLISIIFKTTKGRPRRWKFAKRFVQIQNQSEARDRYQNPESSTKRISCHGHYSRWRRVWFFCEMTTSKSVKTSPHFIEFESQEMTRSLTRQMRSITRLWHQKANSPIHEFKVLQNVFKTKKNKA